MVDGEEPGWIIGNEIFHFAVVPRVPVVCIDLLHTSTHDAPLFNARCVVRQVENRRIVVLVAYLHPERAKPGQAGISLILCFHGHLIICYTDLTFSIEHVCRFDDAGQWIDFKSVRTLIV